MTALYKNGDRRLPSNYRPVSLTSVVCKMLERIIKNHLMQYFMQNNLITSRQHGFCPAHSCETQLIHVLDDWISALESGYQVDVIYLDLQKAFDKVPHARLISKLKSYGIGGILLKWIEDFLSDRRQCVHLRGSQSDWIDITSGVPQGSVLGPFLFVAYVNDLPDSVSSKLYMFADDTKLYRTITSELDCHILQQDLNNVMNWGRTWLTNFNLHKCKVLSFGIKVPIKSIYMMLCSDQRHQLDRVEEEKDLGVLFSSTLKFSNHIKEIVHRANRLIGLIKRTFSYLEPQMLRILYTTLIRPHLDYACVVWNPYQSGDIRILEQVQRRATRVCSSLMHLSYHDRLEVLNLPSLMYRRRRMDMIMLYKILNGLDGLPFDDFFSFHHTVTRSNGYKLYKYFSHLNCRKHFFTQRVINDWNSLPREIIETENIWIFKSKLDIFWQNYRFLYI